MRLYYLLILFLFFFSAQMAVAVTATPSDCNITAVLRVGSKGAEVECLQEKVRTVADGNFGPQTEVAVVVFQSSHGLTADGIVGPLSRAVLNGLTDVATNNVILPAGCTGTSLFSPTTGVKCSPVANFPTGCTSNVGYSPTTGVKCDSNINLINNNTKNNVSLNTPTPTNILVPVVQFPKVLSVSPEKVRSGDTVTIYGENFTPTGNTVRLRYGQIEDRFDNLSSGDGKVISFVFQPPEVKTMNRDELLNLPPEILKKILSPTQTHNVSIDDILAPYRNMKNEDELKQYLQKNGHSFDELYDKFYVTVENTRGSGSSNVAILSGLRKLSFGPSSLLSESNLIFSIFNSLTDIFVPKKVYAQIPEGGTNSGLIDYCTCGSGYLTEMTDISSNGGSGLYWWYPGFVPDVGTPMISGPQLGFYLPDVGECVMADDPCFSIFANVADIHWGEAP